MEACVLTVRRLPEHPLFRRVLDVDPDLLLPYVFDRLGGTQQASIDALTRLLEEGRGDGSVDAENDLAAVAYCLQLTVEAFVLSARITSERLSPQAIRARAAPDARRLPCRERRNAQNDDRKVRRTQTLTLLGGGVGLVTTRRRRASCSVYAGREANGRQVAERARRPLACVNR